MKKLYTILTSLIILILVVHMTYMTLAVMNLITPNEDFAQNLGYILMYSAILHGVYGLVKWIRALIYQRKLSRMRNSGNGSKLCRAARATLIQRILGLIVLLILIPHTYIKVMTAGALPMLADIIYIIALIVHLCMGFPKWIVSLGLCPAKGGRK